MLGKGWTVVGGSVTSRSLLADGGRTLGVQQPEHLAGRSRAARGAGRARSRPAPRARRRAGAARARSAPSSSQIFAASSTWSRAAISVPGCSAAISACARPFASVRSQNASKSIGRAMKLRARPVVDHAQSGGREPPAHLDVDRVHEALVVQPVAQQEVPLARDAPLPEPAPVELLAVAESLVGEHQPVDVGDVVHQRRRLELGRPVGVAEDRDALGRLARRGRRGGVRGSRARQRSSSSKKSTIGARASNTAWFLAALRPACSMRRPVTAMRSANSSSTASRSPCSEPSSTTTTSYSERSSVWSANAGEALAQQVGPLVGGDEDADPRRGGRLCAHADDGSAVGAERPRSGGPSRARRGATGSGSAQPDRHVVGEHGRVRAPLHRRGPTAPAAA